MNHRAAAGAAAARPARRSPARAPLWRAPLILALLALALRVLFLLESADNPFRHHLDLDPQYYDQWARAILGGQLFGPGPFVQAPLYPYFLAAAYALLGADPLHPLWLQALLGSLTVFFGAWVARRHWGRAAGIATGLLLALYKPAVFYSGVLLVPTLAALLLALVVLLAPRRPLLAGVTAGLGGLAHPVLLPGAAVAAAGFALHRRAERTARLGPGTDAPRARGARGIVLRVLIGVAVGLLPATVHNLVFSGEIIPISANTGINLLIGNGPQANGFYYAPGGLRSEEDQLGMREAARLAGHPLSAAAASRFWSAQARAAIAADPLRAAGLFLRKLYLFFHAYESPQVEALDFEKRFSVLLRLPFLPNWILLLTLAAAAIALRPRDRRLWILGGAVLAAALLAAIFFVTGRFRFPAHFLFALMAGAGVAAALDPQAREKPASGEPAPSVRRSVAGRRLLPALVAAGITLLAFGPNWLRIGREQTFGQHHYRLGVIAEREGRVPDAIAQYNAALVIDPQIARAAINLGILTARAGDLARAEPLLQRGLSLDPRSARASLALGQIRQVRDDLAGACSLYARAWAADTTFLRGLESWATATYLSGDEARAAALCQELVGRAGGDPLAARCRLVLSRIAERREFGWPPHATPERAQGDLALGAGDLQGAVLAYQRALERSPADLPALLELASLAAAQSDSAGTHAWLRRFLDRGGDAQAATARGLMNGAPTPRNAPRNAPRAP